MTPFHANRPATPEGLPVQDVATLPGKLIKGGKKLGSEILDMAMGMFDEGATNKEIFTETNKYVNPETETGIRFNTAKQPVFDITDKDARMTPYAESNLSKSGAELPGIPMSTAYRHDLLYDYDPSLKDTPVNLEQIVAGSGDVPSGTYNPPGSPGAGSSPHGVIDTFARGAPNDLSDPFSQRNIFSHEINHLISNKYRMPAGANARDGGSPGMQGFFRDKMTLQAQKVRDFLMKQQAAAIKKFGGGPEAEAKWQRMFPDQADALEQAMYVGGSGFRPGKLTQWPPDSRFFEYESTAGESAARTSQEMAGWTAEKMREESPYFHDAPWGLTHGTNPMRKPDFLHPSLQMINYPNAKGGLDWELPDLNYWLKNMDTWR